MIQNRTINLPAPHKEGGKPFMDTVGIRRSGRKYSEKSFDLQTLSDLLWTAFGVNSERGGRTAPSSHNSQEIDLLVVLQDGVYQYDPFENVLKLILDEDIRPMTGSQPFVPAAPLNVIFVGNKSKLKDKTPQEAIETIFVDSGFISQNIYLFCASFNLRSVVRLMFDKQALHQKLGLDSTQEITIIHTVGYPVE